MNVVVYIFIATSVWITEGGEGLTQSFCRDLSSGKKDYGDVCTSNGECITDFCSMQRCVCNDNDFYDSCSKTCIQNCSKDITGGSGSSGYIVSADQINSPGTLCTWNITASSRSYIMLLVFKIDISSSGTDFLEVKSDELLLLNKTWSANNSTLWLFASIVEHMIINYGTTFKGYRGLKAIYNILDYNTNLSTRSGYIISPGYPLTYPHNANFTWLISGQKGELVTLSIEYVFTECIYDNVNIYDGATIGSKLLGNSCNNTLNVTSTGSEMLIHFKTNAGIALTGFRAFYTTHGRYYRTTCNSTHRCVEPLVCTNGSCGCMNKQFYDPASGTCPMALDHGANCTSSISGMCQSHLLCYNSSNGISKCLCPFNTYFYLGSCYPDSELNVSISQDSVITTNSMHLKWSTSARLCNIWYNVSWKAVQNSSDQGWSNASSYREAFILGLKPASTYVITITSIIASDDFYSSKIVQSTETKETRRPYNYICSQQPQCDNRFVCDNGACRCVNGFFYRSDLMSCLTRMNKGYECNETNECKESLTCINGSCGCQTGQYYHTAQHKCQNSRSYGANCEPSIQGMCSNPDLVCTEDFQGVARCLCGANEYYNGTICSNTLLRSVQNTVDGVVFNFVTFNWLTPFKIKWSAVENITDSGLRDLNGYTINIYEQLTPGQEYVFTLSSQLSSGNESNKAVQMNMSLVAFPASPGYMWLEQSRLDRPPYILRFNQSGGIVASFKITLAANNSLQNVVTKRVPFPELITTELTPNTDYIYEITAFNKAGDESSSKAGSFRVVQATAGQDHINQEDPEKSALVPVAIIGWLLCLTVIMVLVIFCLRNRKVKRSKGKSENKILPVVVKQIEYTQRLELKQTKEIEDEPSSHYANQRDLRPASSVYANSNFEQDSQTTTSRHKDSGSKDVGPKALGHKDVRPKDGRPKNGGPKDVRSKDVRPKDVRLKDGVYANVEEDYQNVKQMKAKYK